MIVLAVKRGIGFFDTPVAAKLLIPFLLGWRGGVTGLLACVVLFFFTTSLILCKKERRGCFDEQKNVHSKRDIMFKVA
jgi:hypothetical protein